MPWRRCLGCGARIRRGSRCGKCLAAQKSKYHTAEYVKNRAIVLVRDAHTCQKMRNGRKCCRYANTADHIDPNGPSTVENMEAACRPCNSGKRDR